jgi:hypothetical protein
MTIAIAQGLSEEHTFSSNTPTALTGSLNTAATGSYFVVVVRAYSPSANTITDTFSNTWTLLGSIANGSTTTYVYLGAASGGGPAAGGSTHRPTISKATGDTAAVSFFEVTGAASSSVQDGTLASVLDSSSPFNQTITTTNATDLVIGIGASNSAANPTTYTPGTGFTLASSSSFTNGTNVDTIGVMSQRVTSTGTYGPNFTTSSGTNAAVLTFALKESASGPSVAVLISTNRHRRRLM